MIARRKRFALAAATLGLIAGACDKAPPPPPDVPPPAPKKEAAAPTTQQLLDGPRRATSLGILPFTMDIPAGWSVQDHGAPGATPLQMLEGPIIGGEAHLVLRQRENVSPERMKLLSDHAKKDLTSRSNATVTVDQRDVGEAHLIERRAIPAPATQPADPSTVDNQVEWRITLFLPGGINYEQFEITFIDLSTANYAANEKLLRELINSLKPLDLSHPPI